MRNTGDLGREFREMIAPLNHKVGDHRRIRGSLWAEMMEDITEFVLTGNFFEEYEEPAWLTSRTS